MTTFNFLIKPGLLLFCNFSVINFDKVVLKCDFHDPKAYQQIPASPLFRLIYNIHNQSQNQKKLHTFRFFCREDDFHIF